MIKKNVFFVCVFFSHVNFDINSFVENVSCYFYVSKKYERVFVNFRNEKFRLHHFFVNYEHVAIVVDANIFFCLLKTQLMLRKCQVLKNILSFFDDVANDFIIDNEKKMKSEIIISLTTFIIFIIWIFDVTITFFLIAFVTSRFFVVHFFK